MSKRRFTPEQMTKLKSNCNVSKCSEKSISYAKEFKLLAVKQYNDEGKSPKRIFRDAGFDLDMIGENIPKERLENWRKIFRTKGITGLKTETRGRCGGRPKTKGITDAYRIKRLEAQVAYLKAENDFLAKLRAKRAE
jgi:transposase-like protein